MCNKGFIWNPSSYECEHDKACDVGEYLDFEYCKCRKKLVAPLIEECSEIVEEVKLAKITLAENENSYKCSSCTVYIVLFWIFFKINVGIAILNGLKVIHMLNLIHALNHNLLMGEKLNKLILKIELIIFTTMW